MKSMSLFAFVGILFLSLTSYAGSITGPFSHKDVIKPHSRDKYDLYLKSDESTRILVKGDGNSDIDCAIFDEDGNLIDKDTNPKETCYLQVIPKWTGKFTLFIINDSSNYSAYALNVN